MSRLSRFWRENRLAVLVIGVLLLAFLALRSSPSDIASVQEFMSGLEQGRPTVVVFYSNA